MKRRQIRRRRRWATLFTALATWGSISLAPAPGLAAPPTSASREVFVGSAARQLARPDRADDLFMWGAATELYRGNPDLSSGEATKLLNKIGAARKNLRDTASGNAPPPGWANDAKLLVDAIGALPPTKKVEGLARFTLELATRIHREVYGPERQSNAQFQVWQQGTMDSRVVREMVGDYFDTTHANPRAREALRALAYNSLGFDPISDRQTILDASGDAATQRILEELNERPTASAVKESLEELREGLSEDLRETMERLHAREQFEREELKERESRRQAAALTATVLSQLATLVGDEPTRQLASDLETMVGLSTNLERSIDQYLSAAGTPSFVASLSLVSGVGSFVLGLVGLLGNSQNDAVQRELASIRNDITAMRTELAKGFHEVRLQILKSNLSTLEAIGNLSERVEARLGRAEKQREEIRRAALQLQASQDATLAAISNLAVAQVEQTLAKQDEQFKQQLGKCRVAESNESRNECLSFLENWGQTDIDARLRTRLWLPGREEDDLLVFGQALLIETFQHPSPRRVPDIRRWHQAAQAILDLRDPTGSEYDRVVGTLHRRGERIATAFAANVDRISDIHTDWLSDYERALDELKKLRRAIASSYSEDFLAAGTTSPNILERRSSAHATVPDPKWFCSDKARNVSIRRLPANLGSYLPASVSEAVVLGGGELSSCVEVKDVETWSKEVAIKAPSRPGVSGGTVHRKSLTRRLKRAVVVSYTSRSPSRGVDEPGRRLDSPTAVLRYEVESKNSKHEIAVKVRIGKGFRKPKPSTPKEIAQVEDNLKVEWNEVASLVDQAKPDTGKTDLKENGREYVVTLQTLSAPKSAPTDAQMGYDVHTAAIDRA